MSEEGNRLDPDDLAQDAFVIFSRRLNEAKLLSIKNVRSYIAVAAPFVFLDIIRKREFRICDSTINLGEMAHTIASEKEVSIERSIFVDGAPRTTSNQTSNNFEMPLHGQDDV